MVALMDTPGKSCTFPVMETIELTQVVERPVCWMPIYLLLGFLLSGRFRLFGCCRQCSHVLLALCV